MGKGYPRLVRGRIAVHVIRIASRIASAQGLQPIALYRGIHQIPIIDAQGVRCRLTVADKFGDVAHVVVFHVLVHDHFRTGSPGQSVQPVITIGERICRGRSVVPQLLRDIPVVLRGTTGRIVQLIGELRSGRFVHPSPFIIGVDIRGQEIGATVLAVQLLALELPQLIVFSAREDHLGQGIHFISDIHRTASMIVRIRGNKRGHRSRSARFMFPLAAQQRTLKITRVGHPVCTAKMVHENTLNQQYAIVIIIDPREEKYFQISPYAYVANNPIRLIDPNGMEIVGDTAAVARLKNNAQRIINRENKVQNKIKSQDSFSIGRGQVNRILCKADLVDPNKDPVKCPLC